MTTDGRDPRSHYWIIPFVLILYVLSTGPVHRLLMSSFRPHGSRLDDVVHVVYFPIIWLADASPATMKIVDWYLARWTP